MPRKPTKKEMAIAREDRLISEARTRALKQASLLVDLLQNGVPLTAPTVQSALTTLETLTIAEERYQYARARYEGKTVW